MLSDEIRFHLGRTSSNYFQEITSSLVGCGKRFMRSRYTLVISIIDQFFGLISYLSEFSCN